MSTISKYVESLNDEQRAAVLGYNRASLIIAGAGSGKTRVITCRIAYMLEQGVDPNRVMALTFTNKAAAEMRERIGQIIDAGAARKLWMGTFHSIFSRILRGEAERMGYPQSFTIYDTGDSKSVMKSVIKDLKLNDETYKPEKCLSRISEAKNNLVTPGAYKANTNLITRDRDQKVPQMAEIYELYSKRCKEYGAMDFDDLLLNVCILFRDHREVLERYQKHFEYILVDEYQDTNFAQYYIVRQLAAGHNKVCVVGDDAQSIYSFRGAKIENILRFQKDFPDAATFKLERNYRSTQSIVEAANSIIKRNERQLKKQSYSQGEKGEKIKVCQAYTDIEEASIITDRLRMWAREGADWSEMAVLYRTNSQSRTIEESLLRRSIPYKVYKGMSFYTRKEIKDLLAYFKLITNRMDNEAFKRVVNYPARGLGDVTIARIAAYAEANNQSLWDAIETGNYEAMELKGATANKVREFVELIRMLDKMQSGMKLHEFGTEVAARTGITSLYRAKNLPEADSALENMEELINSMQNFVEGQVMEEDIDASSGELMGSAALEPTLESWLKNVSLLSDMDNDKDGDNNKVTLMTVHSAKGLEYRHVVIGGLEENLFPSMMTLTTLEGLEEERRLFYVALTRAKESAMLTFANSRFRNGKSEFCRPSRFLSEIDPQYLDIDFELEENNPIFNANADQTTVQRQRFEHRAKSSAAQGARDASAGKPIVIKPNSNVDARFKSVGVHNKAAEAAPACDFEVGMRVSHAKFGEGSVQALEPTFNDTKVTIEFDEWGRKVLLAKFAKLSKV